MENPNQIQELKASEAIRLDCTPPCNGAVCIPRTRYDEMLRAESELTILRRAYQTASNFSMEYIMDMVFDPALKYKPKADPASTSETEATSTESANDVE